MIEFTNETLTINGHAATALVQRYGSPLYVYDRSILDRQIDHLLAAFRQLPIQPFYAMKANANLEILRILRARGFGCDAVSPGEVFLARKAGFESDRIWFTSTNVSDDDLRALRNPSIVINVDSLDSIERLARLKVANPVALRVNPPVGAGHHPDVVTAGSGARFGLSPAELSDAMTLIAKHEVAVTGLHAHVGSGVFDFDPLLEAARYVTGLAPDFPLLRWINLGGGLGVPYAPREKDFPIGQYADALGPIITPLFESRDIRTILEPGRYVMAQSGALLATVTSVRTRGDITWYGCDTGFHHLVRPSRYGAYHHIVNASRGDRSWLREHAIAPPADAVTGLVAGHLCESGDVFTKGADGIDTRPLPPARVGDILAFMDAGAYGFSMASHYNARLLPCEVLVDASGPRVIRERESFDDLLRGQPTNG